MTQYVNFIPPAKQDRLRRAMREYPFGTANVNVPGLGLPLAIYNLIKSAVGSSALFMPICYVHLGLLGGLGAIAAVMALTLLSLSFLTQACRRTGAVDYLQLAAVVGGPLLEWASAFCVVMVLMGPLIISIQLSAVYLRNSIYFATGLLPKPILLQWLVALLLLWPMTWIRDSARLAHFSLAGLLGMLYIVGLCLGDLLLSSINDGGIPLVANSHHQQQQFSLLPRNPSFCGILGSMATLLFGFSNHFNLPGILHDLSRPTTNRLALLLLLSTLGSALFYLPISLASYLNFGEDVPEDILMARSNNPAYIFGQLAIIFVNTVSFPLLVVPMSSIFSRLLCKITMAVTRCLSHSRSPLMSIGSSSITVNRRFSSSLSTLTPKRSHPNLAQEYALVGLCPDRPTTILQTASWGAAVVLMGLLGCLAFESSGRVLDILGAICGGPVILILPALFYWRIEAMHSRRLSLLQILLSNTSILIGVLLMIGGIWCW